MIYFPSLILNHASVPVQVGDKEINAVLNSKYFAAVVKEAALAIHTYQSQAIQLHGSEKVEAFKALMAVTKMNRFRALKLYNEGYLSLSPALISHAFLGTHHFSEDRSKIYQATVAISQSPQVAQSMVEEVMELLKHVKPFSIETEMKSFSNHSQAVQMEILTLVADSQNVFDEIQLAAASQFSTIQRWLDSPVRHCIYSKRPCVECNVGRYSSM
jgi:hypothetical protein